MLSWIPLIHLIVLVAGLWWWVNVFDPSRVKNVSGLLIGFYSFAAFHFLVMVLGVILIFRSIRLVRRSAALDDSQRGLWIVGIFVFNVVAFPVIQTLLRQQGSGVGRAPNQP